MTVRTKLTLLLGFLISLNLAIYGAKVLLAATVVDPLLKAMGA